MQGIFNAISRMRQLQVIMLVNRIIYLMQKIIYVGRFFSEQTYAAFRTKRIIGAIAVVLMLVGGLLEILLYLGECLHCPYSYGQRVITLQSSSLFFFTCIFALVE